MKNLQPVYSDAPTLEEQLSEFERMLNREALEVPLGFNEGGPLAGDASFIFEEGTMKVGQELFIQDAEINGTMVPCIVVEINYEKRTVTLQLENGTQVTLSNMEFKEQ